LSTLIDIKGFKRYSRDDCDYKLSLVLLEKTIAKCILTRQEPSIKRSIKFILDELGLVARQIPVDSFREIDEMVWITEGYKVSVRLEGLESVFLFEIHLAR
jgi:hypothetical protein